MRHETVLRTANFVFKCESVSFNQIRLYIRAAETYSASAARVMLCFRTQPASRCVPPLHPFPRQIAAGSPVFSISDAPFSANFRECARACQADMLSLPPLHTPRDLALQTREVSRACARSPPSRKSYYCSSPPLAAFPLFGLSFEEELAVPQRAASATSSLFFTATPSCRAAQHNARMRRA